MEYVIRISYHSIKLPDDLVVITTKEGISFIEVKQALLEARKPFVQQARMDRISTTEELEIGRQIFENACKELHADYRFLKHDMLLPIW